MSDNSQKFIIQGGKPLKGTITVSGSKNAALPILCAALLAGTPSTFRNVPDIEDIRRLFAIFEELNVRVARDQEKVTIDPGSMKFREPNKELVQKMRASVLIAPAFLMRNQKIKMEFPGGCVLGKRPLFAHTYVFKKFGATILDDQKSLHVELNSTASHTRRAHSASLTNNIIMPEASVTATENALMLAANAPGKTELRLAASEPHVQDLCRALIQMGAKIHGIGTHHLTIEGTKKLQGIDYEIIGDYLEVGTFALAAAITKGEITIEGFPMHHLDSFWQKCEEAGIPFEINENTVHISPVEKMQPIANLKTAIHPSFATDLQAPFAVVLTQAHGVSKIFETLFDGRLSYLFELEKMGARFEVLNPHQAILIGPTPLRGADIASCDIRAGAAMVIAALGAKGQTTINNILYIDRGYENFEEKLRSLGADIERIGEKIPGRNQLSLLEQRGSTESHQKAISTVPSKSVRRIVAPMPLSRERVSS